MQAPATPAAKPEPAQVRSDMLFYAIAGFVVGSGLVWVGGGFAEHNIDPARNVAICAFGGAIFAILGALVGQAVGRARKPRE